MLFINLFMISAPFNLTHCNGCGTLDRPVAPTPEIHGSNPVSLYSFSCYLYCVKNKEKEARKRSNVLNKVLSLFLQFRTTRKGEEGNFGGTSVTRENCQMSMKVAQK